MIIHRSECNYIMIRRVWVWVTVLGIGVFLAAIGCTGSGGDGETPTASPQPLPTADPLLTILPPLEGPAPEITPRAGRTNYWEHPDYQFPDLATLPDPPAEAEGAEFQPPQTPQCPEEWQRWQRTGEGFNICYPEEWQPAGVGYLTAGQNDRYYTVGFVLLKDGVQAAHVSVYVMGSYSRPQELLLRCDEVYKVTISGQPAALCADAPRAYPEARIVQYWIPRENSWVFLNAVAYLDYDPDTDSYGDSFSEENLDKAIEIAHSIGLLTGREGIIPTLPDSAITPVP